jgi:hypothetical protein
MTESSDTAAHTPEDDMPTRELDTYARAEAAMRRIAGGSDPASEAFELANTLNDESMSRFRTFLRQLVGRVLHRHR